MAGRVLRRVWAWIDRRPLALPLLVVIAVLVGLGAGSNPPEGSWTGIPPFGALRWVVTVAVGLMALLGVVILAAGRRPDRPPQQGRTPLWASLLILAVLIALLSLIDPAEQEAVEEVPPAPAGHAAPPSDPTPPGPGFESGDGSALLVILAGALATIWWLRRSTRPGELVVGDGDDPLSTFDSAVGRASRHLLDRSDPRAAVLLAYRDLETTLEGLGLERHPTETPTEHLDRAITALGVLGDGSDPGPTAPLLDLAALYSRARFSHHPITEDEQRRAGLDLEQAHRQLVAEGPRP